MGPRGAMANKRTILIVDDDAELRDALVEQLALHEEFDAISADSGTKGVQAAKNGQVDLVIMDVGLPDVDGREAVRMLKNDYGLKCNKGIDVYLLARKKKACSNFFWSTEIFDKGADGS